MKINAGSCSMFVIGMDMKCPLCGTMVRSGEQHQCRVIPSKKLKARRERRCIMAHDCPECGQACYCGEDDCFMDEYPA